MEQESRGGDVPEEPGVEGLGDVWCACLGNSQERGGAEDPFNLLFVLLSLTLSHLYVEDSCAEYVQ